MAGRFPTESGAVVGGLGIHVAYALASSGHLPLMTIILFLSSLGEGLVALKETHLTQQTERERAQNADSRRFSQIHRFSCKFKHFGGRMCLQKTTDFRRQSKIRQEISETRDWRPSP